MRRNSGEISKDPNVRSESASLRRLLPSSSRRIGEFPSKYTVTERPAFDDAQQIRQGENIEDLYGEGVQLVGNYDEVPSIQSFDDMKLEPVLRENIGKKKYSKPLPIQKAVYPLLKKGYNIIAYAHTGAGKTAAYLVPLIDSILSKKRNQNGNTDCSPVCIILSPTRELAEQIYHDAVELSSQTFVEVRVSFGEIPLRKFNLTCDIFVTTYGRLLHCLTLSWFSMNDLKFIVFDEADKLLESQFHQELKVILPTMQKKGVQKLFFSATQGVYFKRFCDEKFATNFVQVIVGRMNQVNQCVEQRFIETEEYKKCFELLRIMRSYFGDAENPSPQSILIFVNSKRRCHLIAAFLSLQGFLAYPLHSSMTNYSRQKSRKMFDTGACHILVCTDLISRGINLNNAPHVINYDMPRVLDSSSYVNRVGRTGRLGNSGCATTFVNPRVDSSMYAAIIEWLEENNQPVPEFMRPINHEISFRSDNNSTEKRVVSHISNFYYTSSESSD